MAKKSKTESRKKDHVDLVLNKKVQYTDSAGFEKMRFVHNALPELNLEEVDLSTKFLGKTISSPLMISAMTGGYAQAEKINKALATAAQKASVGIGLGSQRAMLEDPLLAKTFQIRKYAPDVPILANIGAVQLKQYPVSKIEKLVSSVDADGLAIHLNALQEVIQPEGDHDFSGLLDAIANVCENINVPVVVKETGAGINQETAIKLQQAGVCWIDVAGSGGTSWSKVEYLRKGTTVGFEEWGIPTVESIRMCKGALLLIASGGVRSGIDAAKAIALGADIVGAAYPFLKAYKKKKVLQEIETWKKQMKLAAFLTGSKNILELKKASLLIY